MIVSTLNKWQSLNYNSRHILITCYVQSSTFSCLERSLLADIQGSICPRMIRLGVES